MLLNFQPIRIRICKIIFLCTIPMIWHYTACASEINNSVKPISYFINHVHQLNLLKFNLSKFRVASLVGVSGVGKTQIARMYSYENKSDYKIIWFFDCKLDLNNEFLKLAKAINEHTGKIIFNDDKYKIKQAVMQYLSNKEEWLLLLLGLLFSLCLPV